MSNQIFPDPPRTSMPEAGLRGRADSASGWRETLLAAALATVISLLLLIPGAWVVYADWAARNEERLAIQPRPWVLARLRANPPHEILPVERAAHGRDLFLSVCAACHGPTGQGIPGLGRSLLESSFVASLDDEALVRFILRGRGATDPANFTKVPMPPRAGRDDLALSDLHDVVTYLRGLQDPRRLPALPEPKLVLAEMPVSDDQKSKWLAAAGGDEELAEYIASGARLYATVCIACHGPDARGLKGNGKDLVASDFFKQNDDDALLAFLKRGRDPGDANNTTGVAMPPKGGNPALSDDDLLDVIAYLRTLQGTTVQK